MIFAPQPQVQLLRFGADSFCCVVDNILHSPDRLVQYAVERRSEFVAAPSGSYPGTLLAVDSSVGQAMWEFFNFHLRRYFDARRMVQLLGRYSLVTLAPAQLSPLQSICHQDPPTIDNSLSRQACVLYLFHDSALGGTDFYEPTRSHEDTSLLFEDGGRLTSVQFAERYAIDPAYMCDSNDYFKRVVSVPARWNRAVFYSGALLHSGHISSPELMTADPATGRLTLNFFFNCRRRVKNI